MCKNYCEKLIRSCQRVDKLGSSLTHVNFFLNVFIKFPLILCDCMNAVGNWTTSVKVGKEAPTMAVSHPILPISVSLTLTGTLPKKKTEIEVDKTGGH